MFTDKSEKSDCSFSTVTITEKSSCVDITTPFSQARKTLLKKGGELCVFSILGILNQKK